MAGANHKKKRKRDSGSHRNESLDTSRPTAVFKPGKGRAHTLSVAISGSIIANAQTHELKTSLAGQIARALAVFCVDEVIIYDDRLNKLSHDDGYSSNHHAPAASPKYPGTQGYNGDTDPCYFLGHVLSYLETPPYLRRTLFQIHPDLRTCGTLPSLDMPHHLRHNEWSPYREGVAVSAPAPDGAATDVESPGAGDSPTQPKKKGSKKGSGTAAAATPQTTLFVDIGLASPVTVPDPVPLNTRVTVRLEPEAPSTGASSGRHYPPATPVVPSAPREEGGYYWGYTVRSAASLSDVFTECPWAGGYDVSIGTSERGVPLRDMGQEKPEVAATLGTYSHLLLVIGGVGGLEQAVAADATLQQLGLSPADAAQCFDAWVDLCPGQGSRTIRAEEALWLGLAGLRDWVVWRERTV